MEGDYYEHYTQVLFESLYNSLLRGYESSSSSKDFAQSLPLLIKHFSNRLANSNEEQRIDIHYQIEQLFLAEKTSVLQQNHELVKSQYGIINENGGEFINSRKLQTVAPQTKDKDWVKITGSGIPFHLIIEDYSGVNRVIRMTNNTAINPSTYLSSFYENDKKFKSNYNGHLYNNLDKSKPVEIQLNSVLSDSIHTSSHSASLTPNTMHFSEYLMESPSVFRNLQVANNHQRKLLSSSTLVQTCLRFFLEYKNVDVKAIKLGSKIKTLNLSKLRLLTKQHLEFFGHHFAQFDDLDTIIFSGCAKLTSLAPLLKVEKNIFKHITVLKINDCPQMKNSTFYKILPKCKSLVHLEIQNNEWLKDEIFVKLNPNNFETLKVLSVKGCRINGDCLVYLWSKLKVLEELDIRDCIHISKENWNKLLNIPEGKKLWSNSIKVLKLKNTCSLDWGVIDKKHPHVVINY